MSHTFHATSLATRTGLAQNAGFTHDAAPATPAPRSGSTRKRRNFSAGAACESSRDEMNLAEFPLAVLSTRVSSTVKTLEFSDSLRRPDGELVERKWIITGADKFGLPTATDDDVVLGLMRITMDQGFRDRKVYFTRYELLKALRWSTEGRSYRRLIKSLDRLSGVRIRSSNSFYDNQTKSYQTCNFGIIDAYEINDERAAKGAAARPATVDGEPPKSFFIWSEMLFDSFKAGFVKKLDLDFYFMLRSAVSRRLYRYLDKHFYYKSTIEMPLMTLAFEKVGLSRANRYVSSIRQQLEPAADELVEGGFLSSYEIFGKGELARIRFHARMSSAAVPVQYDSVAPGQGSAAGESGGVGHGNQPASGGSGTRVQDGPAQGAFDALAVSLVRKLMSRGLAELQAKKLLRGKSPEELAKIESILVYFDHLVSTGDRKVSRSPAGFLYRAVEAPYKFTIPEHFEIGTVQSASPASNARNPRNRPELKVFRSPGEAEARGRKPRRDSSHLESDYRAYCEEELVRALREMSKESLEEVTALVDEKMKLLRTVLSQERYEEARQGCIREEILRRREIPDLERWSALRAR